MSNGLVGYLYNSQQVANTPTPSATGFTSAGEDSFESAAASFQAMGGAWDRGYRMFAAGGVVDRATPFRMGGGGYGLMGEAGPEAIMPLMRGANGRLGVSLMGGPGGGSMASPEVHVHIHNHTDLDSVADYSADHTVMKHGQAISNHVFGRVAAGLAPGGVLRRQAGKPN